MPRSSDFERLASTVCVTLTLLLSGVVVDAVAQQATRGSTAEDSVRDVEMARGHALMRADTVALSRMVATEFTEISRFGQLRARVENMQEIASGVLKLITVRYDSVTVDVYGHVAVLRGIADNTGTYRDIPFTGKVRYTRVFVRRDGRWQAVAMQQTAMQ